MEMICMENLPFDSTNNFSEAEKTQTKALIYENYKMIDNTLII